MQIQSIQIVSTNLNLSHKSSPSFEGGGKPITLQYIMEHRSNLLPPRVLEKVQEILKHNPSSNSPSLMEIHRNIYAPLLKCKTLNEAKECFPEFSNILETVPFQRNSVYARTFKEKTDSNFALKMLQEYWANIKNQEDIAKEWGMSRHSSLTWALDQINCPRFPKNYKTLLNASDEIGNKIIAAKTTAWNSAHMDFMYARNKHAAQGCKTQEFRTAQSARIKEHDKIHPERREKISLSLQKAWAQCPDIRHAMSMMAANNPYLKLIFSKRVKNMPLSEKENKSLKSFYKRFWETHPEFKVIYSQARKNSK